ncbi:MAG: MBL fold metallo-hydrolase [Desulfarculaceae bacterium]|nr:MBL fold metallo-hydrolase [Desulfarculaceae bacterium]MCF8072902.1 MBL fold metallo-hydrolase [Desulfarculaceae bacterium]MCF8101070.1 MBL fold metallo-hydrolase [Desulfarculaceae bacterium]MCF8115543.1 MBL fold metallo-hydrolase [Desulfarculaceae bacterium]
MQLTCLGAARTVTGSSYLIELDDDRYFLVDCGLYQGTRQLERRNWLTTPYRPADLKAIFITHAHIDHSGLVPRLVRLGFKGKVIATKPTCELLKILWLDSAHIQEMEAQWQSKKNRRQGKNSQEALYETPDAEASIELLHPVEHNCYEDLVPGVRACFVGAGHILGASSLHLTLSENGGEHRVGFSGDVGRPNQLIVPDPEVMEPVNTLFMETTYGNRTHKSLPASIDELLDVVRLAYEDGGKVLIPVFAVERSQEIIYTLAAAHRRGELPEDMPVFLDSPLAINATRIFRDHPEFFDEDTKAILDAGHTPLDMPNLKFTTTTEESQGINQVMGPAIIMAGSGMANAGRIKHHLKHNLWRPNTHVVIVGFQAKGTTGRLLVDGAEKVKIFREEVAVRAQVHTINGFSAHADQNELLRWLEPLARPGVVVNLIHGEEAQSLAFKRLAMGLFHKVRFHLPRWNETMELKGYPPEMAQVEPSDLAAQARDLSGRLAELASRLEGGQEADLAEAAALIRSFKSADKALLLGEDS